LLELISEKALQGENGPKLASASNMEYIKVNSLQRFDLRT
jgi:hypothetical protein